MGEATLMRPGLGCLKLLHLLVLQFTAAAHFYFHEQQLVNEPELPDRHEPPASVNSLLMQSVLMKYVCKRSAIVKRPDLEVYVLYVSCR